jgi:hypothetical protein
LTQTEIRSPKPKVTTAKSGIYLEIASRALQGLLANPGLKEATLGTDPDKVPRIFALMACEYTEALIEEANKRMADPIGDTLKDE